MNSKLVGLMLPKLVTNSVNSSL